MDMLETLQELKELNSSHARLDENEVINTSRFILKNVSRDFICSNKIHNK